MFLLLLHDRRRYQVQNQGHRTSGIDVHRPYLCQRHHRHCSLDMFSCVCLEGEQELVRSLLKRTLAAEKFANQIANQLRGTERYQAIQGRIVEAKLAYQCTRLAAGRHG